MTKRRSKNKWGLLVAAGAAVATGATAWWVRHRYVAITVEGMSMSPALYDGEKVLIRRGIRGLAKGRIVVLARPHAISGWRHNPPAGRDLDSTGWYIKRVVAVAGEPYPPEVDRSGVVPSGHVVVLGDHRRSEDSKQHGPCPIDQILGVQVRKLSVSGPVSSVIPSTPTWTDEDLEALTLDPRELYDGAVETTPEISDPGSVAVMPPQATQPAAQEPAPEGDGEAGADPAASGEGEPVAKKATKKAAKKSTKKTAKKAAKKTAKKTAKKAAKKTAKKASADPEDSGGGSSQE